VEDWVELGLGLGFPGEMLCDEWTTGEIRGSQLCNTRKQSWGSLSKYGGRPKLGQRPRTAGSSPGLAPGSE